MNQRFRRSRAQEDRTALKHGGRRRAGSGNRAGAKGDVKTKYTLIENKRTDATQITIKDVALRKIFTEAWTEGRIPVLGFELGGRDYVIVGEADWLDLAGEDALGGIIRPAE